MNVASVLKAEIVRLARKELKVETEGFKKASARYRSEIAGLKRDVASLSREVRRLSTELGRAVGRTRAAQQVDDESGAAPIRVRYSAKNLAAQRNRLGLSAENFGKLLGVSGQTIYQWESEKSRPRNGHMHAIAAIRKLGKREALAKLETLQ